MQSELYVKDICKNKGISFKELANRLNTTPSNLSQILSGDNPRVKTLEAIAEALHVSFLDLFKYPSSILVDERMLEFRDNLARELYVSFRKGTIDDDECWDNDMMEYAIEKANKLANKLVSSRHDMYEDQNYKFAVFEYMNEELTSFIGVFNTYDRALEAALDHSQPFGDEAEYIPHGVNTSYCAENLENPGDIAFCDGEVLFTMKPSNEDWAKENPDHEVYTYVVRTFFLDEPLVVPDMDLNLPDSE